MISHIIIKKYPWLTLALKNLSKRKANHRLTVLKAVIKRIKLLSINHTDINFTTCCFQPNVNIAITRKVIISVINKQKSSPSSCQFKYNGNIVDKGLQIINRLNILCMLVNPTGLFPDKLKLANVVPILKSSGEMIFSNYKPVSALQVFSYAIERLMYNRRLKYTNNENYCVSINSDFKRGNRLAHHCTD